MWEIIKKFKNNEIKPKEFVKEMISYYNKIEAPKYSIAKDLMLTIANKDGFIKLIKEELNKKGLTIN